MKQITIIGSGVAGLWCAFLLSQTPHHYQIDVYDTDTEDLKNSCSYRAGGMIAPYCEAENADDKITLWGNKSIALWQHYFPEQIHITGSLLLAHPQDKNQLQNFIQKTTAYEICDADKISELEPDLTGRFASGLFYPTEGHLEPRKILPLLIQKCRDNHVTFHFETALPPHHTADIIIDTRGLSAKQDLCQKQHHLRGVKGEMIIIKSTDIALNRPVRLLHIRHPIYIVPRDNHIYMIGATTIETETPSGVSLRSAGELLTQTYHLHPAFAEAEIIEMNHGFRPAFDNNMPKILWQDKTVYFNGLYRHGWTIAPALAQSVTGDIVQRCHYLRGAKNLIKIKEILRTAQNDKSDST